MSSFVFVNIVFNEMKRQLRPCHMVKQAVYTLLYKAKFTVCTVLLHCIINLPGVVYFTVLGQNMFYSVQQVVCNFLSLTNGSSWFKVIKVIASSTRASKHMVNKNRMPGKGLERIKEALDNNFTDKLLKHFIFYLLIKT